MNFNQLQYLLAVARLKSFNKAAESLHTTPSNIMSVLNRLEEELGCVILLRSNKGVSLTDIGKRIASDAIEVMAIHDRWTGRDISDRQESIVPIASIPVIYHSMIPAIAGKVHEERPDILCQVKEKFVWQIYEDMPFSGQLSFSYADNEEDEDRFFSLGKSWNVEVNLLGEDTWKVFVSQDHPLSEVPHVDIGILSEYPGCFSMAPVLSNSFYGSMYRGDALFVQNPTHMLHAVAKGGLWCVLPGLFGQSVHALTGGLVMRDIEGMNTNLKYYMFSPSRNSIGESMQFVGAKAMECFEALAPKRR